MNSSADTTHGLATPPLPAAQPLVYITGSPAAKKQCVAEYLSLLLGDQAILIDQPYTSTRTPPPPSSTPPTEQKAFPTRQRPRSFRVSSSSSRSSRSRSTSATTTTATQHSPSSSLDPLLAALSSQPHRTAILTDINRDSPDPNPIVPSEAASQTGRPLIHVQLAPEPPQPPPAEPPAPHPVLPAPAPLVLPASGDPHAAALRIVELVKEMDARSRSQGSWGPVNGAPEFRGRGGDCVCGVITPLLTPAEEGEIRF